MSLTASVATLETGAPPEGDYAGRLKQGSQRSPRLQGLRLQALGSGGTVAAIELPAVVRTWRRAQ